MPKLLVVASNLLNEVDQLPEWFEFVTKIADGGILIVDGGSTDGSLDVYKEWASKGLSLVIIVNNIIQTEGYGPARNHLRNASKQYFPNAEWMIYLDADERILPEDFHTLRFLKDNLVEGFDVIGFPRIDWRDKAMTQAAKDYNVNPDWQARMTRLKKTNLSYVRKLHEQIIDYRGIYCDITNPKIHHFHRITSEEKRRFVGRLCSKLHAEDLEFGHTVPKHHREDEFYEEYLKHGL